MKLRLTGGYDYGSGDETAESYCFDDWGYLYVNTKIPVPKISPAIAALTEPNLL